MKFPISMLRDLVDTSMTAAQVGDLLTMSMFELEGIEEVDGEEVLDIKVVSNRGDGLSVMGLAREVLAKDPAARPTPLYERSANRFAERIAADEGRPDTSVIIETPDCNRYAAKLFRDVPNAQTPARIQRRLIQAGMRPISLFVDLTNYVMLEQGQPLHAFDLDKLSGGRIVVRQARPGEKLRTLNGDEHELRPDQMMICDAEGPVAAAGIMGGLETEVSDSTRNVLLESANFDNVSVRRTRKQMGLNTEASYRFERSVDPELVVAAIERVCELLAEAGAGACEIPGVVDVYPHRVERAPIELSLERAATLLGMRITVDEAVGYLSRLGFQVETAGAAEVVHDSGQSYETPESGGQHILVVTPPTWRPDVVREEDLVEELGRVHGYEKIPEVLPEGHTTLGVPGEFELFLDSAREAALRCGLSEVFSHTLRDQDPLDDPRGGRIQPRHPSSPDTAYLRNSVIPSLADASRRNGARDLHLFEQGRVFCRDSGRMVEETRLAVLSQGALEPAHWEAKTPPRADFFSVKGCVEEILSACRVDAQFRTVDGGGDARLHPTKQALIAVEGDTVGWIGQIHPDVADRSDLPADTVIAELVLPRLFDHRHVAPKLHPISRNPAVRRDIAIMVDKRVPFEQIEAAVRSATGDVLEKQWLFDVYEGQNIPEGKHSLAIALQLRKLGENFTDEEANQVRELAVAALEALGATRR